MSDDEHGTGDEGPEDEPGTDSDEPLGDIAEEVRDEDAGTAGAGEGVAEDGDGPGERDGPIGEFAAEIDAESGDAGADPSDQLFEEVDEVGDVDREALWRQVAGEDAAARVEEVRSEVEDEANGPTVKRPDDAHGTEGVSVEDREERVVDKAKYCHNCEYFSGPPETRCTHSGTEILEMVDVDHFRVVDCPVVAEDEELENV